MIPQSSLCIELPFPPSVNHYWRHVVLPLGKGEKGFRVQTLISADGRKYKETVIAHAAHQKAACGIRGPVHMHVTLHPPDRRRRDVDNYAKALLDGIVEAKVIADDSQVMDLRLAWGNVVPGGKAVVTIMELPATAQGSLLQCSA